MWGMEVDKLSILDIMLNKNYRTTRLDRNEARKLIAMIVARHPEDVLFSTHSLQEIESDDLTTTDVWNVLRSPSSNILRDGEIACGSWRYRLETRFIMVVVAFHGSGTGLTVVTVWDKRKRSNPA